MQFQSFNKIALLVAAIFWMALVASDVRAQEETSVLLGDWVGGYEIDGEWHFVEAHFEPRGDQLLGSLDFRFDMTIVTFVEGLRVDGETVQFELEKEEAQLAFNGRINANQFSGTVSHADAVGTFSLTHVHELDMDIYKGYIGNYQLDERVILLYSLQDFDWFYYLDTVAQRDVRLYPLSENSFFSELGETIDILRRDDGSDASLIWRTLDGTEMTASRTNPYQVEEVQYPYGDITLAGTLLLPDAPGPHPAIVLMHSSGPQNRDYFRRWGHYFAEVGIATLVYDKPGAFDSAHPSLNSFWENSVQSLADAAIAGVHYLQSRPEINPQQVGIRTYSNSSWAGPLAASQSDDVAFIIGTAVSGVAQRQADIFQEDLNSVSRYDYPNWATNSAFEYLRFTREFAIFARELSLPIQAPYRDYYGLDFDPLTAWTKVTQPVLIVNGQYDTLVDPVDAVARIGDTLAANGNNDYTLVVYPDADHGLLRTETGLKDETDGGRDAIFAPGVMAVQTDWVLARFDGQQATSHNTQTIDSPVPVQISQHFEEDGRYELLPWYGRPTWQLFLLLLFVIVFGAALVSLPIAALIRWKRGSEGNGSHAFAGTSRLLPILIWISSLLAIWLIVGLILTWVNIVHLYAGAFFGLPEFLNSLPILAPIAALLLIAIGALIIRGWRNGHQSVQYTIFAITGLLFIWYLGYWHLLVG